MSSSYGLPTFSLTEMDDIMEVSSEHGHNDGDEDIDIDIDLTAGQVDEDYVLEDATSNAGLDDDFSPQPSPAAANDDPMVDEDEEVYHHEHNEDLIQHKETDTMDHGAPPMSFESAEPASTISGNGQVLMTAGSGDVPEREIENLSERVEEQAGTKTIGHLHDDEDAIEFRKGAVQDQPADAAKEDQSHKSSRSSTPHHHRIADDLKSASATAPGSPDNILALPNLDVTASDISEESEKAVDVTSGAELSQSSSRQVVVVYRNSDYVLFASSESDDPDSFFLSDLSIAEKPLTNFFEAIRDVIRDDLGDDEELYIVVEDLGLEIMEDIGSYQDVTFAQIVNLHNKLLKNEGVESPGSLHLHLGCRPNFARRFSNLAKSAVEGKGLSEVVQLIDWDEHSDSPDEMQKLANDQDDGSALETQGEVEESGNASAEETYDASLDQILPQEPFDTLGLEKNNGLDTTSDLETAQQTDSVDVPTLDSWQALADNNHARNSNGEYDEDSDLIDYSDEEVDVPAHPSKENASGLSRLKTDDNRGYNGTSDDFFSSCLKPLTCFCSKCMEEFSASERAKEEEYRRRSKSRQADENNKGDTDDNEPVQQIDIAETSSKDDDGQGLLLEVEDGVDYDDDDHGDGYVEIEHKTQLTNDESYQHEGQVQNHSNGPLPDEEATGQEEFGVHGSISESRNGVETDEYNPGTESGEELFEDEIEFDEVDFTEPEFQGSSEVDHVTSLDAPADNPERQSAEAVLGPSSRAGSESDKTLEKQPGSDILEEEDEINYDDDDEEQETFEVQPVVFEPKVPPRAASGKRPRADELSDEGNSTRSNDAKRPRS